MTITQAYDAAFLFLDHLYFENPSFDDLGNILGAMSRASDGMPMEQAYWTDWMRSYWEVVVAPTAEEKEAFSALISESINWLGKTSGDDWYASLLPDGRQIWANVRNGVIQYGSIRMQPRPFDPQTGLSSIDNP